MFENSSVNVFHEIMSVGLYSVTRFHEVVSVGRNFFCDCI